MRATHTNSSNQLQRAHIGQKIRAEVVLGSPSANCGGVGICRVMAQGETRGISCPTTETWISATKEGKLRFEFLKSSMEGRFMKRHFRWMLFQVLEDYLIPYPLLRSLKIAQRTIHPGIYQVWENEDRLIVDF